jgi:hypothetical protein
MAPVTGVMGDGDGTPTKVARHLSLRTLQVCFVMLSMRVTCPAVFVRSLYPWQ